jgi:hypothetical protein
MVAHTVKFVEAPGAPKDVPNAAPKSSPESARFRGATTNEPAGHSNLVTIATGAKPEDGVGEQFRDKALPADEIVRTRRG